MEAATAMWLQLKAANDGFSVSCSYTHLFRSIQLRDTAAPAGPQAMAAGR